MREKNVFVFVVRVREAWAKIVFVRRVRDSWDVFVFREG